MICLETNTRSCCSISIGGCLRTSVCVQNPFSFSFHYFLVFCFYLAPVHIASDDSGEEKNIVQFFRNSFFDNFSFLPPG